MIQAAMMFALGFSVCGLIALALYSALSRRTRRLAEQRVKRRFATKRQEFETERDELRARHAIDMQRLEREVRTLGDEATAYRLDAAIKDIEINSLNSELDDREDAIEDLSTRLETLHDEMREGDRKLAESGTALRAARHALQMQAQNESFETSPAVVPVNGSGQATGAPALEKQAEKAPAEDVQPPAEPEEPPADTPEAQQIRSVADEIKRIADETEAEILQLPVSSSKAKNTRGPGSGLPPPIDPAASPPPSQPASGDKASKKEASVDEAEEQIQGAMEEIEALKTSSGRNAAE